MHQVRGGERGGEGEGGGAESGGMAGGGGEKGEDVGRCPLRGACGRAGLGGTVFSCFVRGCVRGPVVNELGNGLQLLDWGSRRWMILGGRRGCSRGILGENGLHHAPARAGTGCNGATRLQEAQYYF